MIREKELICAVANALDIKVSDVKKIITEFKSLIIESLEEKHKVHLVGLGTFKITVSKPRTVVNLHNQKLIKVKSKNLVKFYPATSLRVHFSHKRPLKTE